MSKHTPGPWETQPLNKTEEAVFIIGSNLGGLVGAAHPWPTEIDNEDYSRVEANARLMAAAPELLAALQLVLNHPMTHLSDAVEPVVRAAIAKTHR